MYYIQKTLTISAAHNLNLSYESKCEQLHGHNWVITVYCKAKELNQDGMVTDFTQHISNGLSKIPSTTSTSTMYWMLILRQKILQNGFAIMWKTATK